MTDLLLVSGFADQDAVDRFVKSEMRYFRSRDLRAYRCEAPGASGERAQPALAFVFGDRPDLGGLVAALSRSHPGLLLAWSREEGGRVRTCSFQAGAAGSETTTEGRLSGLLEKSCRELEEIYGTS